MERTKLRAARVKKHWTLEKAAEAIGVGVNTLHQWEKGRAVPHPVNRQRLCEVYGAMVAELDLEDAIDTRKEVIGKSAEELGLVNAVPKLQQPLVSYPPEQQANRLQASGEHVHTNYTNTLHELEQTPNLGSPLQRNSKPQELENLGLNELRRRLLQQIPGVLGAATVSSLTLFNFESWERLSKALNKSSSLEESTLNHLETIIGNYWQLFYTTASSDLLHGVLGFLRTLTSLLEGSYPTHLEQQLCTIAGKTSLLAGRIALDQDAYSAVDGYYAVSLQAAQRAGDTLLQAVVLARIGSSFIERNQPKKAVTFFQEAQRLCSPHASTTTSTWLAIHEAEAWAMMHQETSSLQALETAENYRVEGEDPYWTGFNRSLLFGFKGVCNLQLQRLDMARQALEDALVLTTPLQSRQTAIFFTDIASTFARQGELEEACSMSQKALHFAASTRSTRVMQRLLTVRVELERWSQEPSVKRLDEQLLAIQHLL